MRYPSNLISCSPFRSRADQLRQLWRNRGGKLSRDCFSPHGHGAIPAGKAGPKVPKGRLVMDNTSMFKMA
jgi:hypothetical protein